MSTLRRRDLPLVYSCSGCSAAAQTANTLAVRLDRSYLAEMSCIAGVGGDVEALVRVARSGRTILAIDGCPLHCTRATLARQGVTPDVHIDLSAHGVRKQPHQDPDTTQTENLWHSLIIPVVNLLHGETVRSA
ncbi:MAG: putative zinc-binding protein [Alcanivoracaceae bacterium]|nr:putative zinc-binding protein [Alcanivoracaceae bacterium]